jgi:hypothetical protein
VEWEVFILMAFLNPSLQWIRSRACSDEAFSRIAGSLEVLVADELQTEEAGPVTQPRTLPSAPRDGRSSRTDLQVHPEALRRPSRTGFTLLRNART